MWWLQRWRSRCGIVDRGDAPALAGLVAALAGEDLLLVLDNFEHLLSSGPAGGQSCSPTCPRLCVLATSREPLRLRGEHVVALAPLSLPQARHPGQVGAVLQAPATALFVERVRARDPMFALDLDAAQSIADICRRLDGLPLAIELAAARIGLLTPSELATRLGDALDVLGPGPRDAPDRHQTLQATMDWSSRLLDAPERDAFTALAAFTGGCTLEAAELVAEASLTTLDSLISKSLLVRQSDRLAMLETVREYGVRRLAERADASRVHRRHAEYMLTTARRAQPRVRLGDPAAIASLDSEIDNLRAALSWTREHDRGLLLDLSATLTGYWRQAHRSDEGRRWVAAALPLVDGSAPRIEAELLLASAQLVAQPGSADPEHAKRALAIFDSLGDPAGVSRCLGFLSADQAFRANWHAADVLADRALACARAADDDMLIGASLRAKSMAQPNFAQAEPIAVEAAEYLRRAGNVSHLALLLSTTAFIAITDEAYERADELLRRGPGRGHDRSRRSSNRDRARQSGLGGALSGPDAGCGGRLRAKS